MKKFKRESYFSHDAAEGYRSERRNLKRISVILSALCTISFSLNFMLGLAAGYFGFAKTPASTLVSLGAITIFSVFVPFAAGGKFLGGVKKLISLEIKSSPLDTLLIILFGLGACVTINFITVFLSEIFPFMGGANSVPSYGIDIETVILMLFALAFLPAICEEFAFRGIVVGVLSNYGDSLAAVISAMLFALLHQQMSTIIFAFCSGMIFWFAKKATGSVVSSVIIHFLNNSLGVITTVLSDIMPKENYILFYYSTVSVMLFIALVTAVILFLRLKEKKLIFSKSNSVLTEKEKFSEVFRSIFLYFGIFLLTFKMIFILI